MPERCTRLDSLVFLPTFGFDFRFVGTVGSVSRILVHPDYVASRVRDVSLFFLAGDGIPNSLLSPVALNDAAGPELHGVSASIVRCA